MKLIPIILYTALIFLSSSPLSAQSLAQEKNLEYQYALEIIKKLGLEQSSPEAQEMLRSLNEAGDESGPEFKDTASVLKAYKEEESKPQPTPQVVRPVIKHIKGTQGIGFDSKDEIRIKYLSQIDRAKVESFALEAVKNGVEKAKQDLELDPLPACYEAETLKEARPDLGPASKEFYAQKLHDELYIRASDNIGSDLKELYGNDVVLRKIDYQKPNFAAYTLKSLKVKCLPFRLRITNKFVFQHFGDAALLNYDRNPNGKGLKVNK